MSSRANDRIADHDDWRDNKLDIIIKALNGQTEKSQD